MRKKSPKSHLNKAGKPYGNPLVSFRLERSEHEAIGKIAAKARLSVPLYFKRLAKAQIARAKPD